MNICDCQVDSDCQAGAPACADVRVCDTSKLPYRCQEMAGTAPKCAGTTDDPCTKDVCAPKSGKCEAVATADAFLHCTPTGCTWIAAPPGAPTSTPATCDDGDACTQGDICAGSVCAAGKGLCECKTDADCAAKEDGDGCNGTLFCDKQQGTCALNPATVVSCDKGKDGLCSKTVCVPATGACVTAPVEQLAAPGCADGVCAPALPLPGVATPTIACDDGDSCTAGEFCKEGKCIASADTCKCGSDADCDSQEDGNVCNGTLYCDKAAGVCKLNPATVVQCPSVDDTACSKNVCFPKTGLCQKAPIELTQQVCGSGGACHVQLLPPGGEGKTAACDDTDACTEGDVCKAGACVAGTDTCICSKDADCAKFEDGDHCNGKMFCHKATQKCAVNPASIVPCQTVDDTACTKAACVPANGACSLTPLGKTAEVCTVFPGKGLAPDIKACVRVVKADDEIKNLPCEDGDACTAFDVCAEGKCAPGKTICACKVDADCAPLDDGNLCNGTQFCNKQTGSCTFNPTSPVTCKTVDDTACLVAACSPKSGLCQLLAIEQTKKFCDAAGACRLEVDLAAAATGTAAKAAAPCEDGQPCTKGDACAGGSCKPGVFTCECATNSDCASKEDGNACNGSLYCDKSDANVPTCKLNPASTVSCGKHKDACLANVCSPADGQCKPVPSNGGAPCDDGSACSKSDVCKAGICQGGPVDCDDGSACTNDSCDPLTGCVHQQANCADGNGCTLDACDAKTGKCAFPAMAQGAACDADQSGCTVNDVCEAGVCKAGAQIQCSLQVAACEQPVCVSKGATQYACQVASKPNGDACDDGDACTVLSFCKGGACNGNGKERFFTKTYAPALAEGGFAAVAPAPSGGLVLVGASASADAPPGKPKAAWWVVRVDAAGEPVWQASTPDSLPTEGSPTGHGAQAAFVEADGTVWVVGAARSVKGDLDGRLVRYNPLGKQAFSQTFGTEDGDEALTAAKVDPFGISTLVGWQEAAGARVGTVWRVTPSGDIAWKATSQAANAQREWQALVVGQTGGASVVWVAGAHRTGVPRSYGLLAHYNDKGALLLERVYGDGDIDQRFVGMHRHDNGDLVLAGVQGAGAAVATLIVGVASDLYPRWSGVGASGSALAALAFQGGEAGHERLLVAGRSVPLGGIDNVLVRATDRLGNTQWTRTLQAGGSQRAHAVVAVGAAGKEGVAVAGERIVDGARHGLLLRTDAFGHGDCTASGACLAKAPADCDDDKPCSIDGCDGKVGCTATPQEALRCDPGDECSDISACAQGECAQTSSGRLHMKAHLPGGVHGGGWRLAILDDGGVAAAGTWYDSTQRSAVIRVDHRMDYRWHTTLTGGTGSHARAIAPVSDGGAMTLGRDSGGGWAVRRFGPTGNQVWAQGNAMVSGKDAFDLDVVGPDHFVLCAVSGYGQYDWRAVTVHRFNVGGANIGTQVFNVTRFDPSQGACDANNQCYGKNGSWGIGNLSCASGPNGVVHVVGTLSKIWCNNNHSDRNLFYARIGPSGVLSSAPWIASAGNFGSWNQHNWNAQLQPNGYEYAQAVDVLSDGGAIVSAFQGSFAGYDCQWDQPLGNRSALIIRTNASGQRLWHLAYGAGGDFRPIALGAYPGGHALVGGYVTIGNSNYPRLERRDAAGNAIFARTLSEPGFIADMAALPSGDIAITGYKGGWLLGRIDRYGNLGCQEAGMCAAHGDDACDDGKACTADACTPTQGCVHTPIAGVSCP